MNTTTETKPTAGAMQAASVICRAVVLGKGTPVASNATEIMATTIDRETHLPELIAVCRAMCDTLTELHDEREFQTNSGHYGALNAGHEVLAMIDA